MALATYITSTSFSVSGDYVNAFSTKRKVMLSQGVDGTPITYVSSAEYSASTNLTTVTTGTAVVTSNLTSILLGASDPTSVAYHGHSSSNDGGLFTAEADESCLTVAQAFTYASSSPLTLSSIEAGDRIVEARIEVDTAFDDGAATLSIGRTGLTEEVVTTAENSLSNVGIYIIHSSQYYSSTYSINAYISPGTSTQGAGRVLLRILRA